MPHARQRTGAAGEQRAADWYVAAGYIIVARNWRCRAGEVDLVASKGAVVVFCEVKTRSSDRFGSPAEAVTPQKQRRIRQVATAWLQADDVGRGSPRVRRQLRFDVASVLEDQVEVIEGAF